MPLPFYTAKYIKKHKKLRTAETHRLAASAVTAVARTPRPPVLTAASDALLI
jgi:hypothetical protein